MSGETDIKKLLAGVAVLPIVVIDEAKQAPALADTLLSSGLTAIEITLRTPTALDAIEAIAKHCPQITIGAGSVRSGTQMAQAQNAGADFLVSPGATPSLLRCASLPYVPGAATASECLLLLEHGIEFIKFFPAEASGGLAAIDSIAGPLPDLTFCPTGGITEANARAYLAHPSVSCVGGSWCVPRKAINDGDFRTIGGLARRAADMGRS